MGPTSGERCGLTSIGFTASASHKVWTGPASGERCGMELGMSMFAALAAYQKIWMAAGRSGSHVTASPCTWLVNAMLAVRTKLDLINHCHKNWLKQP
jgi:hypothetical protein